MATAKQNSTDLTIRLGNEDFKLIREKRKIKDLRLDPSNQRISFKIKQRGVIASDKDLHNLIWELDSVKDLYQSIYQNGGLIEDPIITDDNLVVEGNCRTVALREINKKFPGDERFSEAFVRVLPKGVTDEQKMLLLGELHIAGKIEWKAYEQAEYVWKMNKLFGRSYDYLASHLRWSRSKLSQKIFAYEETKAYIENTGDKDGITKFSYFEEFMKKKELREKRENESGFMKEFGGWVFNKKLTDSRDVRQLPEILDNPEAYKKFLSKDIKAAITILHQENPSLISNLYSTIDNATEELKTISLVEVQALKDKDPVRTEKVKQLKEALENLESFVGYTF